MSLTYDFRFASPRPGPELLQEKNSSLGWQQIQGTALPDAPQNVPAANQQSAESCLHSNRCFVTLIARMDLHVNIITFSNYYNSSGQ